MQKFLNKFSFILILIILAFSLSGCSNNTEENLENYYYVMAIGLDTASDTKINLNVQIATNSSERWKWRRLKTI